MSDGKLQFIAREPLSAPLAERERGGEREREREREREERGREKIEGGREI